MKFSDIRKEQWLDVQPYLDTCLLPLTALSGLESPWEATAALERLRDCMDAVEIPFKGRIITYPALHYLSVPGEFVANVNFLCRQLKATTFQYVFLITVDPLLEIMTFNDADLFLVPPANQSDQEHNSQLIRTFWQEQRNVQS